MIKIINSKNSAKQKFTRFSKKIIASTFLISIIFSNINNAYSDLEENEKGAIRVYPKSYDPDKKGMRNLISSPELKVEYLEVNSLNKKIPAINKEGLQKQKPGKEAGNRNSYIETKAKNKTNPVEVLQLCGSIRINDTCIHVGFNSIYLLQVTCHHSHTL